MIGLKKKELKLFSKRKKVTFKRFFAWDCGDETALVASESLNCDCGDGFIKTGLGMSTYYNANGGTVSFPSSSLKLQQFNLLKTKTSGISYTTREMLISTTGNVYVYDTTSKAMKSKGSFGTKMQALNFPLEDLSISTLLYGDGFNLEYEDVTGGSYLFGDESKAACVYNDRAFILIDPQYLYYTAPGNLRSIANVSDDAGRIFLPENKGKGVGLESLDGALYVFFEYGIARVSEVGSPMEFLVESVAYGEGKIIEGSVKRIKDKICFLTENGIIKFDGKKAERAYAGMQVKPRLSNTDCRVAAQKNGWILSFYAKNNKKTTLVLDFDFKNGYFTDEFIGLCECDGNAYCMNGSVLSLISENGSSPPNAKILFTSKEQDFSIKGKKTLKSLSVKGSGAATICIKSGKNSRTYSLPLYAGEVKNFPMLRGESFVFEIDLESYSEVHSIEVEIEYD